MTTETTELLPCPFCGIQPVQLGKEDRGECIAFSCHNLSCNIRPETYELNSYDEARNAWNNRASVDRVAKGGSYAEGSSLPSGSIPAQTHPNYQQPRKWKMAELVGIANNARSLLIEAECNKAAIRALAEAGVFEIEGE